MEAAPPSYQNAVSINPLDLIARYIPTNDLCSAALVCSGWHATITPHLWGNPASHFGSENDRVYVALTKFRLTLQIARPYVRSLTHTLHMPPAHAEIYNGPHADWLRDVLDRLPNLQSLIVRGLPFFDHSALQALKYQRPKSHDNNGVPPGTMELPGSSGLSFASPAGFIPSFGLRLLDASRCPNVTSSALAQALARFESLLYLDLSFTYPARDPVVLKTFRRFSGLQVLKLRGISLTDEGLEVLATSIARRVRSLDIRNNAIGDRGIRTLLDECFTVNERGQQSSTARSRSPGLLPYMGTEMLEIYQSENFESFLRNTFTGSFVTRQAFEDAPEGGITHLYIAKNKVSAEGAAGLMRSGRLHVLDLEGVTSKLGRHLSNSGYDDSHNSMEMPGVEKLTPVVAKCAGDAMTFLRIDHRLITKNAPASLKPEQIVQGRVELDDTAPPPLVNGAVEIDSTAVRPEAVELPAVQTPKYELPGDPMAVVISPPTNNSQQQPYEDEPQAAGPRRGSAFAPEVVGNESDYAAAGMRRGSADAPEVFDSLAAETKRLNLLSPVSAVEDSTMDAGTMIFSPLSPTTTETATLLSAPGSPVAASSVMRPRSYSSVADERKARLNAHVGSCQSLHPAMLPHVRELVLTDVPPFSPDRELSDRLITFIKQCAEEAWLAQRQASVDYALPPGRKGHASALKHSAEKVFALNRIVLELATEESTRRSSKASPWVHANTKSMTDDRDSESLWSAAETDFSFFGDEDYSFPSLEPGRFAHSSTNQGSLGRDSSFQQRSASPQTPPLARFDTVALLSAFRKERKAARQRHIQAGSDDPETEGFWPGVVSVIRPGNGMRFDEQLDYYGNRFQKGYLYP